MVTISERLEKARKHRLAVINGDIQPQKQPTFDKLSRLRMAIKRWNAAGRPIADRITRKERGSVCKVCPNWSPVGNFGLGECRTPGCGCTRAKWWLKTERCPLGKW